MQNYVYVVVKSILDNERHVDNTGSMIGGFELRSKSVREVYMNLEDAEAYLNKKADMFKDYGRSVYKWENEKVIECTKKVRDRFIRIDKYEIVVKEVR